ncbi:MAG: hypothetical protein ACLKAK_01150 [Alkaliphilus sp.]
MGNIENAGAIWIDAPSIVDGHLVSSRRPADLPMYMIDFINTLETSKSV